MLTNINTYEGFCSNIFVSHETFEKFRVYHNTLIKWQKSINLISTFEQFGEVPAALDYLELIVMNISDLDDVNFGKFIVLQRVPL